jgi:hypothetical protein
MVERSLVDAVEGLDLKPRQQRWRSLSYCVLDAVWSIGAVYDTVVAPLVWRVAAANGDSAPLISFQAHASRSAAAARAFEAIPWHECLAGAHEQSADVASRWHSESRRGASLRPHSC